MNVLYSYSIFSMISRVIILFLYLQALSSTVAKKGGLSSGHVAAQYQQKNAVLDVKVDTESNVVSFLFSFQFLNCNFVVSINSLFVLQVLTTFTLTDIPPSTKTIASFKLPDYKSGKVLISVEHGPGH